MSATRRDFDGSLTCAVALAVLLAAVTPAAAGVVPSETASVTPPDDPHDPLLLQPTPATVQGKAGQNVTVRLMLLNRGNTTFDAPIVNVGQFPANWTVVNHTSDGGRYRDGSREWLWQYLGPEKKVRPTLTVSIPENATGGTYTLTATADDANGYNDTATVRLVVTPRGSKEKGPKNRIGDPDVNKVGGGPPVLVGHPRANPGDSYVSDRLPIDRGREQSDNGKSDEKRSDNGNRGEKSHSGENGDSGGEKKDDNGETDGENGNSDSNDEEQKGDRKNEGNGTRNGNETNGNGSENDGNEKNGTKENGKSGKQNNGGEENDNSGEHNNGDEKNTSKGQNEGKDENGKKGKKSGQDSLQTPEKWLQHVLSNLLSVV